MKINYILTAIAIGCMLPLASFAQPKPQEQPKTPDYQFTTVKANPITSVKNQNRSGTCWCYSGIGFLESEIIKAKNITDTTKYPDLSEMFVVSKSYHDRSVKYVRMDGSLGYGSGSEFGDVLNVIKDYGIVPQSVMTGMNYGTELPVQGELDAVMQAYVDAIVKNPNKTLSTAWVRGLDGILNAYLGECPEKFAYEGANYTPATYRDHLGINPDDYVSITSFTHHPFYQSFPIEVSDNWRWDTSYNVPIDEMMQVVDYALDNGFTIIWGTDVSEQGFTRNGIAVLLPEKKATSGSDQERWTGKSESSQDTVKIPQEAPVTQESRQSMFDNKTTTDDHGMQIYGIAKDQNGTRYYLVKNSWGTSSKYHGIWYASGNFVKAKTIDIVVNKKAVPADIRKKLGF